MAQVKIGEVYRVAMPNRVSYIRILRPSSNKGRWVGTYVVCSGEVEFDEASIIDCVSDFTSDGPYRCPCCGRKCEVHPFGDGMLYVHKNRVVKKALGEVAVALVDACVDMTRRWAAMVRAR
jgi:hypothetical protein